MSKQPKPCYRTTEQLADDVRWTIQQMTPAEKQALRDRFALSGLHTKAKEEFLRMKSGQAN